MNRLERLNGMLAEHNVNPSHELAALISWELRPGDTLVLDGPRLYGNPNEQAEVRRRVDSITGVSITNMDWLDYWSCSHWHSTALQAILRVE